MFSEHADWAEALVVVHTMVNDIEVEEIFSAGADGKLLRWHLDVEKNCDIYECIVSGVVGVLRVCVCVQPLCVQAAAMVDGRGEEL